MNKVFVTIATVICFASATFAQNSKKMTEEEKIKEVVMSYEKGLTEGNVEALVSLYTEDATFIPNQQPAMEGNKNFTGFYQYFFNTYKVKAEISIDKVVSFGDTGMLLSHSKETMTAKDGSTFSMQAREMFLLKKINGAWKIYSYLYNEAPKDK